MMKFSTRAGVLLFAFGATAASAHGVASAVELAPAQVATAEDALSHQQVPLEAPVGEVLRRTPAPLHAPSVAGELPASAEHRTDSLIPEQVVRPLTVTRLTPVLGASLPLPGYGKSRSGRLDLQSVSAPLRTVGPALGLGDPMTFRSKSSGDTHDGAPGFGELDPRLVTAPISAIPGARARLSQDDRPISIPHTLQNGLTTTDAMAQELPSVL